MIKIGLLSDTHGFIHPNIFNFFKDCDEIWHAGDFGNIEVANKLATFKPLRGVYGNIDGHEIRINFPQELWIISGGSNVLITHIGGYPGRYDKSITERIRSNPPDLFISGHSHILKVVNDKKLNLLHINPGAAGKYGWHKVITFVKFEIHGKKDFRNMELMEIPRN